MFLASAGPRRSSSWSDLRIDPGPDLRFDLVSIAVSIPGLILSLIRIKQLDVHVERPLGISVFIDKRGTEGRRSLL